MKTISIRTHEKQKVKEDGNDVPLTTLGLIKILLHNPPASANAGIPASFSIEEMRKRFKILDKIEALTPESTVIELEDADAKLLSTLADKHPWGAMDKFIVEFADSLK